MRVLFCWANISGYMAHCWRKLSMCPDMNLHVLALQPCQPNVPFSTHVMDGLSSELVTRERMDNLDFLESTVRSFRPDVLVIPGWGSRSLVRLSGSRVVDSVRLATGMDTPFRRSWRQYAGRLFLHRFLSRFQCVFVAGERSWQYARFLGVSESRLHRGTYGFDFDSLRPIFQARQSAPGGWPRSILYLGRYEQEKAIDVLVEGYRRYRSRVSEAWPLICHGAGSEGRWLASVEGIRDGGFIQPEKVPQAMVEAGVFVIASRYEPWGVVIAEACGSGLPVVCTEACGASVELVRPYVNGLTVATDDPNSLADAFHWMTSRGECIASMGARSRELAYSFSGEIWAQRWNEALQKIHLHG